MKKQGEKRRGILRPSPNEAVSMSFLTFTIRFVSWESCPRLLEFLFRIQCFFFLLQANILQSEKEKRKKIRLKQVGTNMNRNSCVCLIHYSKFPLLGN